MQIALRPAYEVIKQISICNFFVELPLSASKNMFCILPRVHKGVRVCVRGMLHSLPLFALMCSKQASESPAVRAYCWSR